MGSVLVKITTTDDAPVPVPIDGVRVSIYDGGIFLLEGYTGSVTPGEVEFMLDGDVTPTPYEVRLYKAGVSFFPQPEYPIAVTDPPSPSNEFTFVGHVGMLGIHVVLSSKTDDTTPVPVQGVRFKLYTAADTYLMEGDSDASGNLDIVLQGSADPGTEYIVRLAKPSAVIVGGAVQKISVIDPLAVGQTNVFDFVVHHLLLPETSDPQMCRLSGSFVDAALRPIKDLEITFYPREGFPSVRLSGLHFLGEPSAVRDMVLGREVTVKTDKNGYIEVDLPRFGVFDISVQGLQIHGLWTLSEVYIPDLAGIDLMELLFPYVSNIVYSPTSVAVAAGGNTVQVDVTPTASNFQLIGNNNLGAFIEWVSEDTAIAQVAWDGSLGKLLITGMAAGTTTVNASRRIGTVAPRRPPVPDIVVTPLTVVVS